MDYIDLGRRVKDLRRKQNLTQEALAEKLDISASFLGHIERGTRIASLETLVKLCIALDTDPNYLLAASTSSLTRHMPENTRKQLAELFYQGYRILQSTD
jgi:transcriptional regulator with XRE-family HTH domain